MKKLKLEDRIKSIEDDFVTWWILR
jgi:hypothetical protein